MATWHTDYILGDDTTGDGSSSLPFKTLTKAFTLASSNDTFKVAGSTLSDVSGVTVATAASNSTIAANIDLTGILAPGDVISITHPIWGTDKFFYRVHSVSGTTFTVNCQPFIGSGLTIRKFNELHYTSTSNTTFETGQPPAGAQILGGWDSTFTSQNGWTVARHQGSSTTTQSSTFMSSAPAGNDMYAEKFAFISLSTGFGGTILKQYWGDLIGSRTGSMIGGYAPNTIPGNTVKWYWLYSSCQSGTGVEYRTDGSYGIHVTEFYSTRNTETTNRLNNTRFLLENVYLTQSADLWSSGNGLLVQQNGGSYGNIYLDVPDSTWEIRLAESGNHAWNGTLTYVNQTSNLINCASGATVQWNNPTQNVTDEFNFWTSVNNAYFWSQSGTTYIKDIEGLKNFSNNMLVMTDSSEYVTGNNSLKYKRIGVTAGQYGHYPIAQFRVEPTTTTLTIEIIAKVSGASALSEIFEIQPFNIPNVSYDYSNVVDTTWTTVTINVTGSNLERMKANESIAYVLWKQTGNPTSQYMWVDSVNVTQS